MVSSVYDPRGFSAPFILNAKMILQDLCRYNFGWDNKILAEYMHRWQAWLQELPKLKQLEIDQCIKSLDFGEISLSQLHHFSDASQQGYRAVTYLRITDHHGNIKCSFVMGNRDFCHLNLSQSRKQNYQQLSYQRGWITYPEKS